MGGGTFDVYRVCERMAGIDLGVATSVLATFLGSDPIVVGATDEQRKRWLTRIAEEGLLFAYGATEPEAGSDLGSLRTSATPVVEDGEVVAYHLDGAKQWISNGGIADVVTILALAPGGPSWFVVDRDTDGFSAAAARGQARHPSVQHRCAVPRRGARGRRPPGGRRGGPRSRPGAGGVRLHPPDGRGVRPGRRVGGAAAGDGLLDRADPGGRSALGEAGLHPQADRPARGPPRGGPRLHRGHGDPDRRRRGQPEHRGCDRQVPRERVRQRSSRGCHPGARRLRLHPGVPGREDQARRAHHHDLRRHVRDHGDDDREGSLAGAPQDAGARTTTTAVDALDAARPGGPRCRSRGRGRGPARTGRAPGVRPHPPPDPQPARAVPDR